MKIEFNLKYFLYVMLAVGILVSAMFTTPILEYFDVYTVNDSIQVEIDSLQILKNRNDSLYKEIDKMYLSLGAEQDSLNNIIEIQNGQIKKVRISNNVGDTTLYEFFSRFNTSYFSNK